MPAIECLDHKDRQGRKTDVNQRRRNQPLPTDVHQLIVTEARQRPAQPEIEIKNNCYFGDKDQKADYNIEIVITLRFGESINKRKIPAAEIDSRGHCGDHNNRTILGHKKERPTKSGVFSMEARY